MSSKTENVEPGIRVSLTGKGSAAFIAILDSSGITYVRNRPAPGNVVAGGDVITIATTFITAIGTVLAAWVASRKSRNASITHNNYSITQINVELKPEQISSLLADSSRIMVFDTDPAEDKPE
ncbi:MAG: hypothetical protein SFX18_04000 [Pirellulales bacterium]|nr:hypothetical protein [Pirellulales bacterium]